MNVAMMMLLFAILVFGIAASIFGMIYVRDRKIVRLVTVDPVNKHIQIRRYKPNPEGYVFKSASGYEVRVVPVASFNHSFGIGARAFLVDAMTGDCLNIRPREGEELQRPEGRILQKWAEDETLNKFVTETQPGFMGAIQRMMPLLILLMLPLLIFMLVMIWQIVSKIGG